MSIGQAWGVSLQPAWLLHYQDFRETSFIVDLFSLQHGRVAAVARGARSSKPASRALYQPFRPLLVSWVGEGDLLTLTGIEPSGTPLQYSNKALACAYYLNELVVRLLDKGNVQTELFAHYAQALDSLATSSALGGSSAQGSMGSSMGMEAPGEGESLQAPLRLFELQLLDALGVLPDLAHCLEGNKPIQADGHYRFYPSLAVAEPAEIGSGDAEHTRVLPDGQTSEIGVPVAGQTLLSLHDWAVEAPAVLDDARLLMRRLVRVHLGDRPLKSRSLLTSLVPKQPSVPDGQ